MLAFIYNNFKIDLTNVKVTFNEVNPWFQDELSSEYSFPFNMPVDDWKKLCDFSNYNSTNFSTTFVGKLYRDGEIIDATLKVQEQKGKFVSGIIFAGLNGLSVLDVPLSELPLEQFDVADIRAHAMETITKNYPEVSHNFPMVHTEKYSAESEEFRGFEGTLNNYRVGAFVTNSLEEDTNLDNIRNIMQPLPYLLYVLQTGFSHFGLSLEGDVLTDPDLMKATLFRDGEYFISVKREKISFNVAATDWVSYGPVVNGIQHMNYYKEFTAEKKGDYTLLGNLYHLMYTFFNGTFWVSRLDVSIKKVSGTVTTVLYDVHINPNANNPSGEGIYSVDLDIPVTLEPGDKIILQKTEARRDDPVIEPDYPEVLHLDIIPLRYYNPDGSPILSVLDINRVDLKKVVPDMTLIDLVSIIRKWKNFGFTYKGKTITMDYVQPKLRRDQAKDLSAWDIKEPVRSFHEEQSFELFFTDGKANETYRYDSLFVDRSGERLNEYRVKDETVKIEIDALYYPIVLKNGNYTAFAFDDDVSKVRIVFYRAVSTGSAPVALENNNLSIPKVYESFYKRWLDFRIFSIGYQWDFVISVEKFREVQLQSLIYAYKNFHILTEVEKERLNDSYWRITAKSESFLA